MDKMTIKLYVTRKLVIALIVMAGIIVLSAQTNSADPTSKVQSLGQGVNRFLGYFEKATLEGYVVLRDYSDQPIFSVSICAPGRTNFSEGPLQVWLLATNGNALPALEGGVLDPAGKRAGFTFKKTQSIEMLQGVFIQSGEVTKYFAIPVSVHRLSAHSQFLFDNLKSISVETQEKFEAGRLRWKKDPEGIIVIKGLKQQLRDEGVGVLWNKDKRVYQIE